MTGREPGNEMFWPQTMPPASSHPGLYRGRRRSSCSAWLPIMRAAVVDWAGSLTWLCLLSSRSIGSCRCRDTRCWLELPALAPSASEWTHQPRPHRPTHVHHNAPPNSRSSQASRHRWLTPAAQHSRRPNFCERRDHQPRDGVVQRPRCATRWDGIRRKVFSGDQGRSPTQLI